MANTIPLEVKRHCVELAESGTPNRAIYQDYFAKQFDEPAKYAGFRRMLHKWKSRAMADRSTLEAGTYEGFIAHGATVQVSAKGEIVQAWVKQHAGSVDPIEFIEAIRGTVPAYEYQLQIDGSASRMLEIPLFDMHWGINYLEHYERVLCEILELISSHHWAQIVIPFGQDFFHNDSIVNGQTTKGTQIEKVDMQRAVKEGQQFVYAIVDAALANSNSVRVLYTPGNHDRSVSWMFMQVLLERYGSEIVDDSLEYRKAFAYGANVVMVTHGDSKQATPKNLAHIFPIAFPEMFAEATIREVHSGHLHYESEADIYGVMVRRLSSGSQIDEWSDKEDYVGTHRRFMLFEWGLDKLKSIHYI